jgi:hypothetical protein
LLTSLRFPPLCFVAFAGFPISLFNGLRANSSAVTAAFRILWRLTPANILLPPLGGDPLSLHLTFPHDGESGAGGDPVPPLRRHILQEIEADRMLQVSRIEKDYVVGTRRRDMIEEIVTEIAVRVDDADACTSVNVLEDEIA